MKDVFKEILPSLLLTKEYALESEIDEKEYNSYVVNKALSYHIDCILTVNIVNSLPFMDNKLQYDFYYHTIKPYKRPFKKWVRANENKNLETIVKYYDCSWAKAKEILTLLSPEQIIELQEQMDIGGRISGNTK